MASLRPRTDSVPVLDQRERIAEAARDLFASQGYDQTTVDAIAERAGVGRRTFFRYFRSKDDAIFPDHVCIAAAVEAQLGAFDSMPPVAAACAAARVVFRCYIEEPQIAVQRYRLTRTVPALRDREIASVSPYTRLVAHALSRRFSDVPGGRLRAEVIAAAVVAAHNHVLREWLRGGGVGDPRPALEESFAWVQAMFGERPPDRRG